MTPMRPVFAIALLSIFITSTGHAVEEGDAAPRWNGVGFDGSEIAFPAVLGGKPAVVVFWATWCPYCKAFMPYLERIQAEYGVERISVLMINAMEDGEGDPRAYLEELDFPKIAVQNGDDIAAAYGVEYTPALMVIDADGRVAYQRGPTQMAAGSAIASLWFSQIRATLRDLLEE
jgi:cytochrome c biogenesis protein CcmG/thiol:disulfide interchange protein DsbE